MTAIETDVLEERANSVSLYRDPINGTEVEAVRRRQRDDSSLWAIKRLSCVLNRDGEWEYEPQPSSRDDAFIARTRWASLAEAEAAWRKERARGASDGSRP